VRLALISEIHANVEALQATLNDIALQAADRIVCLGDIVGYNTNPRECIALLRKRGVLCVAGNHDRAVCSQISTETFSKTASHAATWTREHLHGDDLNFLAGLPLKALVADKLVVVHGALHPDVGCESVRLDSHASRALSFEALMAHPSGARICAFGHTHEVALYELHDGRITRHGDDDVRLRDDAYYLVNPGTVGMPSGRDSRASYMILDLARQTVTVRRVAYDLSFARAKTRRAGLAPYVSYLPPPLRIVLRRSWRALRPSRTFKDQTASSGRIFICGRSR
jgi:predicted phosphodiesterase